jgi:hypothetical protein
MAELSHSQQALWFLHTLAPDSPAHNTGTAVGMHPVPDVEALRRAVAGLSARHDMLRSTFAEVAGRPTRLVGAPETHRLEVWHHPGATAGELHEAARAALGRPFRLGETGAFRTVLLLGGPDEAVLLIASHHIASDATSHFVLLRDLLDLYAGTELPPLAGDYADYVRREAEFLASDRGAAAQRHWRQLCSDVPAGEIPADHGRPGAPFLGDTCRVTVSPETASQLGKVAAETGVTESAFLLGVFQGLLCRSTRQSDFLIGCPTTTRVNRRTQQLVGNLVNTLPIRARFSRATTFREAAIAAGEGLRSGLQHIGYPYPLLAGAVQPARQLVRITFNVLGTRHPHPLLGLLLDVEAEAGPVTHGGFRLTPVRLPQLGGELDLMVNVSRGAGHVAIQFRYNTGVYEPESMRRLAGHFTRATDVAAAAPDTRIATARLWDTAS